MKELAKRLLLASCALAFGCGDDAAGDAEDNTDHANHGDHGGHHDQDASAALDGAPGIDAAAYPDVPCDDKYPGFTAGMSTTVGALTAKLVAISPAPPRQKVRNTWTVQVVDATGAPATNVTLEKGDSYMVVHDHHGNREPDISAGSEPGTFELAGVDFIMRGPWQVLFDVVQSGTRVGRATFQICVE